VCIKIRHCVCVCVCGILRVFAALYCGYDVVCAGVFVVVFYCSRLASEFVVNVYLYCC